MQRKFFQQAFSRQESLVYQPLQLSQAHKLLKDLLSSPENFEHHTRRCVERKPARSSELTCLYLRFAVSLIVDITYGYDIKPENDPFINLVEDITVVLDQMGDNQILNVFPFRKCFPAHKPQFDHSSPRICSQTLARLVPWSMVGPCCSKSVALLPYLSVYSHCLQTADQ